MFSSCLKDFEGFEELTERALQYVNYTTYERYYKASFFEYVDAFKQYQEQ